MDLMMILRLKLQPSVEVLVLQELGEGVKDPAGDLGEVEVEEVEEDLVEEAVEHLIQVKELLENDYYT
jgi:hypothetical protein